MLARFHAYKKVLDDCIEKLVKEEDAIFTGRTQLGSAIDG
jgi:hypothetical protein